MNSITFAVVAYLSLVAGASAGLPSSQSRASCVSGAIIKVDPIRGPCTGSARASCSVRVGGTQGIDEQIRVLFTTDFCDPVSVTSAAQAVATAMAQSYSQALSQISCASGGYGCGYTLSSEDAIAVAQAEALAKAVTAAFQGDSSAICVAELRSVATRIAQAASSGVSKSCIQGRGSATAFRSGFVSAAATAIAEAIASATAQVCNKPGAECKAKVQGSTNSNPPPVARSRDPVQRPRIWPRHTPNRSIFRGV